MSKKDDRSLGCFIMILLVAFLAFRFVTMGGIYSQYSNGIRTGELVKFSQKGFIFKSWEGQIKISENSMWEFSAVDPAVIDVLNKNVGNNIDIGYNQWWMAPVFQDSEYTAKFVTPHKK